MSAPRPLSPGLKTALEFGPLLVFFAAYLLFRNDTLTLFGQQYQGFILATLIFIPVQAAATLVQWALTRHLSAMQVVTLVLVVVFGGISVWFNDPRFFKMKPTILYLLFAAVLAFGAWQGKNWLQLVFGQALAMQPEGWKRLERRVVALFVGLAVANEIVWRTLSEATWVNFKTFGLPLAIFAFFMLQAGLFKTYGIDKPKDQNGTSD